MFHVKHLEEEMAISPESLDTAHLAAVRTDEDLSLQLARAVARQLEREILMRGFDWNPQYDLCFDCGRWWPLALMRKLSVVDHRVLTHPTGEMLEHYGEHWLCPMCERRRANAPDAS
jgi:hypothetical protein